MLVLLQENKEKINRRHTNMKTSEIINENGVGIITKQNQTADVGPNEIKKQAKKMGFTVDKHGRPPLLRKNKSNKSPNVLYNVGLTEDIEKTTITSQDLEQFKPYADYTSYYIDQYPIFYFEDDESDVYLLADYNNNRSSDDYKFIGLLRLFYQPTGWYYNTIFFDKDYQGTGLAIKLLKYAIINDQKIVATDRTQTAGSESLWKRLSQDSEVDVYVWDGQDQYEPYDPSVGYNKEKQRLVAVAKDSL